MTEIQDQPGPRRDAVRLLLEDLACVSGTLSEIMTAWRRATPGRPELRLSALTQLQDTARRLAADIEAAACTGQRRNPASSVAERFSTLWEDLAGARATTCAPGASEAGDRGLWELLTAAMHRAGTHLTDLMPDLAAATG